MSHACWHAMLLLATVALAGWSAGLAAGLLLAPSCRRAGRLARGRLAVREREGTGNRGKAQEEIHAPAPW